MGHLLMVARSFPLIFFVLFASAADAADAKVGVSAEFRPAKARFHEFTVLEVSLDVPRGFHLYSMTVIPLGPRPLRMRFDNPGLTSRGEWHCPRPESVRDENFKKVVEYYSAALTCRRAYRVDEERAGELSAVVGVDGQICDDEKCIAFSEKIDVKLAVSSGVPRKELRAPPELPGEAFGKGRKPPAAPDSADKAGDLPLGAGLMGFLIIAFLAGLGAIATPCVFPMIPITVSYFSKYSEDSFRRAFVAAATYAVSIVLSFTFIGILVSAIFGAVGMQTLSSSPWFNLALSVLLVFFAFNLFGLFEMRLPNWLIASTSEKERTLTSRDGSLSSQLVGIFFMALTFTLVSFTCTVGFVGVVLTEAAKGNWFYPALGMLSFSIAFSMPFFFLALFPSWAEKLQGRGGDWMVAVKVTLGFLELAASFKFLSNVDLVWKWGFVTRPFVLVFWVALFFTAGLYLIRVFGLPSQDASERRVGPIRMSFAVLMFAAAVYLFTGIGGEKSMGGWLDGWLPPAVYPGASESPARSADRRLPWIVDDIPEGMKRGRELNRPVFIDFTGYTCTNCRYMEGAIFTKPEVRGRFQKMVLVSAYTDALTQVAKEQREYQLRRFETAALPFYAIIDPRGDKVLATFASMTNDVSEYLAFLDEGLGLYLSAVAPEGEDESADAGPPGEAEGAGPEASRDAGPVPQSDDERVDFELPLLKDNSRKVSLSSLRGSWVFVNFWASWCVPCLKELREDIPSALGRATHIGLVTVAFDGEDTRSLALELLGKARLPRHTALCGGEEIARSGLTGVFAEATSLPQSFLVDPAGRIVWKRRGSVDEALLVNLFRQTHGPRGAATAGVSKVR